MSCVSASLPQIRIPGLDLLLNPVIVIPIPGLNLCCNFWAPFAITIPIPIGLILAALGAGAAPVIAALLTAINVMNSYIKVLQFSFSCPLD